MDSLRYAKDSHRPGEVWKTDQGNWRSMNSAGDAESFDSKDEAETHAKGSQEHGESKSDSKGGGLQGFFARMKGLGQAARELLTGAPPKMQKLVVDKEHRQEVFKAASAHLKEQAKKTPGRLYHAAREEVKEVKTGVKAVKKLLRKPPEKLTRHDKQALAAVGAYVAGAALAAATGGAAGAAVGIGKAFAQHVGFKAVSHMLDGAFTKFELGEHTLHGVHHVLHHLAAQSQDDIYLRLAAESDEDGEDDAVGAALITEVYKSVAKVLGEGMSDTDVVEALEGKGSMDKESALHDQLVRLARTNPSLEPHLRPLLRKGATEPDLASLVLAKFLSVMAPFRPSRASHFRENPQARVALLRDLTRLLDEHFPDSE